MKGMKTSQLTIHLWAAIALIVTAVVASTATASDVPTRKDSVLVSVKATVTAIDQKTREVTLKGPLGNSVTFTAGPEIKRLGEVQVGDSVSADYYVSVVAELRKPTAEEMQKPLTILESTGRAIEGAPSGSNVRRIEAVTTIEGLDRPTQTITVKGPRGRYLTARVADPSRLEQLRIGQTIVITYTEAIAVSLEKTAGKPKD
jgi:hypothetical protein